MSKKHKSKKKTFEPQGGKRHTADPALAMTVFGVDDGGLQTLSPTEEGARKLENIRRLHPKLRFGEGAEAVEVPERKEPTQPEYNPIPMSEMLDKLEDLVKEGKYKKAMELPFREAVITDFVDHFTQDTTSPDNKDGDSIYGMCRKLLSICKSFYEYADALQELLPNATYDGLLAKYLKSGKQEPTGIVPKGKKNLRKVALRYPTLHNNVDKAYILRDGDCVPNGVKETDSVQAFLTRVYKAIEASPETEITLDLSPKLDGVSVNGTVNVNRQLIDPQTRGDNDESVAVTGLSGLQIAVGVQVEDEFGIQYEAFCTDADRLAASEYLGLVEPYRSNRHAASGIIHRLCTSTDDNLLKFISLYPIEAAELDGTFEEKQDYLNNFAIVPSDIIPRKRVTGSMESLLEQISEFYHELEAKRETLSYSIDGVVITVVDGEYQETIGRDGRTNKWQIAMKFDPATASAVVKGITLDNGKKGYRTIQVMLEHPVFIDGVRYDHVPVPTLARFNEIGLRYESTVTIHRVGDAIPSITVDKEGTGYKLTVPTECPSCGKRMIERNKKLFCENPECEGNVVGKFTNFFTQMGLVGYAESFAALLHDTMGCKNLADVLKLSDEKFQEKGVTLAIAPGFVDKLKEAIGNHWDYEVIGAMALPGVGPQKAKMLLEDLSLVKDYWRATSLARSQSVRLSNACRRAVGPNLAWPLEEAIRSAQFCKEIMTIAPLIKKVTTDFSVKLKVGHTGGDLKAETVQLIEQLGYEVVDGSSFDILITSSMGSTSTKMTNAKNRNLPIFLEDDFVKVYQARVETGYATVKAG